MGKDKEKKPHRISMWIVIMALWIALIVHQYQEHRTHQEMFRHHQQMIEYKQQILDQEQQIYDLLQQFLEMQQS